MIYDDDWKWFGPFSQSGPTSYAALLLRRGEQIGTVNAGFAGGEKTRRKTLNSESS